MASGGRPGAPTIRHVRRRPEARGRRPPGGGDGRLRDVGRARTRRIERGAGAARAEPRQSRRRSRGSRPRRRRLVGRHRRSRVRRRQRPVLRGVPQRARRVPGHHRTVVRRRRRAALRLAVPGDDDPRPGRVGGCARRCARHRPLVRGRGWVDGRHARARVGRRPARARRARRRHLGGRAGHGRGDRALPRADARHPRRPEVARGRLLRRRARRRAARGARDRARHRSHQLPHRARARGPVRTRPPAGRGALRRRSLCGRVLHRLPRRQARPALRRQHVPRVVRGDEPPRRRPRPRRHREPRWPPSPPT